MDISIYDSISVKAKKDIFNDIKYNKIDSAINKMKAVIYIEELNVEYKDDELENACVEIANKLFRNVHSFIPIKENYVFCDSLMWDNHGLTQQYLKAIMSLGKNILFINTGIIERRNTDIVGLLNDYGKATILYVPNSNYVEQIKFIYQSILDFRPDKVFMHSFSIPEVIALYKLDFIDRYRINLGNHLTWLGLCCTDYMIEFNDFGYTISVQKRNFPKEKIFKHPFYPIVDSNNFEGFPQLGINNKVLMYSGGALYKIKDDADTFLNIVKHLLLENPNLVFLFSPRDHEDYINDFISKNSLQNNFYSIGYRKDINEVFKHIDIFIQTYPIGGGLMEKYALMNSKPVLTYCTKQNFDKLLKIDDNYITIDLGTYKKAYTNLDAFYKEAKKLINSKDYREHIGKTLNSFIVTEESFNDSFNEIIYKKGTNYNFEYSLINYCNLTFLHQIPF